MPQRTRNLLYFGHDSPRYPSGSVVRLRFEMLGEAVFIATFWCVRHVIRSQNAAVGTKG